MFLASLRHANGCYGGCGFQTIRLWGRLAHVTQGSHKVRAGKPSWSAGADLAQEGATRSRTSRQKP